MIEGSATSPALRSSVVGVDPATNEVVVRTPDQPSGLVGLAIGQEGIWTTDSASGTVVEFSTLTGKKLKTLKVESWQYQGNIATGLGYVWVVDRSGAVLTGIIERTTKIQTLEAPPSVFGAVVSSVALWITDNEGGFAVEFPVSGAQPQTVELRQGAGPIAAGEGAIWVTSTSGDMLWSIDETSLKVRTKQIDGRPLDVAAGEGSVWVLYE